MCMACMYCEGAKSYGACFGPEDKRWKLQCQALSSFGNVCVQGSGEGPACSHIYMERLLRRWQTLLSRLWCSLKPTTKWWR